MDSRKIGLSTSSFGYTMGVNGGQTDRRNPKPWTLEDFVDFAIALDLGGIEVPIMRFVPDLEQDRLKRLHATVRAHEMFFLLDAERALDAEQIVELIPIAMEFNSPFIRVKSSNILGLARRTLGRPWSDHVEQCIRVLKEIAPQLRHHGLRIAIENHQDLDSNDLIQIIERVGTDVVGVNFDIGNAFASCEDPIVFARKLESSILNIHLKDYKIFRSEDGFRLVRCPIGSGSVDFTTLLPLLSKCAPDARMVIELGAHEARHIAWLDSDFWTEIQARNENELITFFQLLERQTIRTEDHAWMTLWERGASPDDLIASEKTELDTSLTFITTL